MTQDVEIAVTILHFEIAVIGSEPPVEHLGDFDVPIAETEAAWRLLTSMTGIALDLNDQERRRLWSHS